MTLLGPDLVTGRRDAPGLGGVAGEAQAGHPAPALTVRCHLGGPGAPVLTNENIM